MSRVLCTAHRDGPSTDLQLARHEPRDEVAQRRIAAALGSHQRARNAPVQLCGNVGAAPAGRQLAARSLDRREARHVACDRAPDADAESAWLVVVLVVGAAAAAAHRSPACVRAARLRVSRYSRHAAAAVAAAAVRQHGGGGGGVSGSRSERL
jgi:hypothetical protein